MSYWGKKARIYSSRGGRYGAELDNSSRAAAVTPTAPPPPMGQFIHSIRVDSLNDTASALKASAVISDSKVIASYNWLDSNDSTATIMIPGEWKPRKPPLWTEPRQPLRLREDDGTYFRDKNAARYPQHPMEPAVVACLAIRDNTHFPAEVDVMACGSTLGSLLRFVRGHDKTFRMLVEKVRDTVFFIRRENAPAEVIPDVRGYGHSFPEACTAWEREVKGSGTHQRLVRYGFGGLRFVVRAEADGYIQESVTGKDAARSADIDIDDLIGELSNSQVSPAVQPSAALKVKIGGSLVPQSRVFDLKTRSIFTKDKKNHLGDELPRLWVSRIPNFILAFHTRGVFEKKDIAITDVRGDVQKWQADHSHELAHFAALVHQIIKIVSARPDKKLELCHLDVGRLDVREQLPDAGEVLSRLVRARWEDACVTTTNEAGEQDGAKSGMDGDLILDWEETKPGGDFTSCSSACGYCGKCS
ncbi:hypothetical protein B0T22DRAFT_434969 [Podospora appendiculata]|uniref:Geranylgeranyl pyrophosphate synthetase n=1 Tax=Podospora appendiculata TaxID=314037 RepID=A0AAE0WYU4_9PEZI|nr:hypothetical protein B0T22DRAFT_434969 [Podospora appendiculata]